MVKGQSAQVFRLREVLRVEPRPEERLVLVDLLGPYDAQQFRQVRTALGRGIAQAGNKRRKGMIDQKRLKLLARVVERNRKPLFQKLQLPDRLQQGNLLNPGRDRLQRRLTGVGP